MKKYFFVLFCSFLFSNQPNIRIISPIAYEPIITSEKITILGEVQRADYLIFNNQKIDVNNGLFRIIIPKQSIGKKSFLLSARNSYGTYQKELSILTLQTLPDVNNDIYKKSIEVLLTLGTVRGYKGTDFYRPNFFITRAELIFYLINLLEVNFSDKKVDHTFRDLYPNHWAYEYIQLALNKNLVKPQEADFFGVDSFVSRKEIVLLLRNFFSLQDFSENKPFTDINYNLAEEKILSDVALAGYLPIEWTSQKKIYPNKALTRAEAAYLLAINEKGRELIKKNFEIDFSLIPIRNDYGKSANSVDIKFNVIKNDVYKVSLFLNTEQKIVYIILNLTDGNLSKNLLLADDGNILDKVKGDNFFVGAINLDGFNKDTLSYSYKLFNPFNLIEEVGESNVLNSNGKLYVY
jgi:hypothetical protein